MDGKRAGYGHGLRAVLSSEVRFMWLDITGRCQLRCVHCYADSGPESGHGTMTAADWKRVIGEAADAGVRMVQFIGGEPTLYPALPMLIGHALARDLEVEVFTNLVHVTPALWEAFSRPGVRLATSWYTDDPAEHASTHRPISPLWASPTSGTTIYGRWAVGYAVRCPVLISSVGTAPMAMWRSRQMARCGRACSPAGYRSAISARHLCGMFSPARTWLLWPGSSRRRLRRSRCRVSPRCAIPSAGRHVARHAVRNVTRKGRVGHAEAVCPTTDD